MTIAKLALDQAGRVVVIDDQLGTSTGAPFIAAQAYDSTYQALWVDTGAVAAADGRNNGLRFTTAGALRVYDATAGLPATTNTHLGMAMTTDGQVCITSGASTSPYVLNGVAMTNDGRVYVDILSFALEFADLGAGVVSTVEAISGATPTFTRATAAWTKLSTGLWAEVASGNPRSFYSGLNTSVGSYLGYLAEGARTNSALHGRLIAAGVAAAAWVESNVTAADDATGIGGVANSASTLTAGANDGTILQSLTIASAAKTLSAFVRRKTGTGAVYITLDNDTTRTEITSSLNTGTYVRVSATQTLANPVLGFKFATSGDAIEVDMVMLENSASFASSPIPTTTLAVARNADVLTYPTTGWFSATNGTMYEEVMPLTVVDSSCFMYGLSDATTTNQLNFRRNTTSLQFYQRDGGASEDFTISGVTVAVGTAIKMAGAYSSAVSSATTNGVSLSTGAGAFAAGAAVTTLSVGSLGGSASASMFAIKRLVYYASRLPNAVLQALTNGSR